jgi:hypothetical protein
LPLIEIQALPGHATHPADVARAVNQAVAAALGCRLDAVWTTWRTIDDAYVQGDMASAAQPAATHGPIVHIYLKRSPDETERVCAAVTGVLERELSLAPGNVFITTQPVEVPG